MNPTTIVVQQNADGSYDIPAITLVPYVPPGDTQPPVIAPPVTSPPGSTTPPPTSDGAPNIGAIQPGETWQPPEGA